MDCLCSSAGVFRLGKAALVDWLYALIGAAFLALIGVIWTLVQKQFADIRRECSERDEMLWNQVGRDSFSGMRKIVHAQDGCMQAFVELDKRVDMLERHEAGNR